MSVSESWPQVRDWRKQQRAALIARREAVPRDERRQWSLAISELIESGFALLAGRIL